MGSKILAILFAVLLCALAAGALVLYFVISNLNDQLVADTKAKAQQAAVIQQLTDSNHSVSSALSTFKAQLKNTQELFKMQQKLQDQRQREFQNRESKKVEATHEPDAKDWSNQRIPDSVRRLFPSPASTPSGPENDHGVPTSAGTVPL